MESTATATYIRVNDFSGDIATIREAIGNALEYRGSATALDNLATAIKSAREKLEAASDSRNRAASYLKNPESRNLDSTFRASDFTARILATALDYADTVIADIRRGRKARKRGIRGWIARLVG
jgi:hypothetical protein